jgi:tellurite resistance protein
MRLSYDQVEPFLVNAEVDGTKIYCEFQTPDGEIVESAAVLKKTKTVRDQVAKKATRVVKSQARRSATRLIRGALGGGMAGRIGSSVLRGSMRDMGEGALQSDYTESDKQDGIVKAFSRVARQFGLSSSGERLKERAPRNRGKNEENTSGLSEYHQAIKKAPVRNLFEQDILARLLVEIAGADGQISPEEQEFLKGVLPRKLGTIQDIQRKDPISKIEIEELNDSVKETIFLMAWSVSLVDYDLDPAESQTLFEYGEVFGLRDHRIRELAKLAKYNCIEQSLTPETSRDDLYQLADGIELNRDEAERCMIQYKKRMF